MRVSRYGPGSATFTGRSVSVRTNVELVHAERTAPSERAEDGRMPDLRGRDVERLQLGAELLGVVDQRQQIGERNELAVVQAAAHEARVVVAPLLAVGDHVHAGAELRVERQPDGVVGGGRELRVAQPALHVLVHGLQHPARPRPAADAHDGQRPDGRGRRRRRQRGRDAHRHDRPPQHRGRRRRPRRGSHVGPAAQRALADEEAALAAGLRERDELVAGEPAPGREVLFDRDLDGAKLQELAGRQRIEVLADQEQEPVAAIQVAAVEADVGRSGMTVNGLAAPWLSNSRRGCPRRETPRAWPRRRSPRRPPGCFHRACAS